MRFKDKVAVVLGASAEGGTGWAIAEALAGEGAKVVVAARSLDKLEKLAKKIDGLAVACDAADHRQIENLARKTVAAYGRVDIAVNSAALPVLVSIADATPEDLQNSLDVNYLGQVHFIKNMAAAMKEGGSIVLISSLTSEQPMDPHFAYACGKAATDCLVRYAAMEYGPRGIKVNSVLPGPIKSAMATALFATPGVEETFIKEIPLRRVGRPEDYAEAVLWLCGPSYVTGLNLHVSGGNQLTRMPRQDELPFGRESYGM